MPFVITERTRLQQFSTVARPYGKAMLRRRRATRQQSIVEDILDPSRILLWVTNTTPEDSEHRVGLGQTRRIIDFGLTIWTAALLELYPE